MYFRCYIVFFDMLMFFVMCIGLFGLFNKYFNNKGRLMRFLSTNAFGAYIFHSLGIVLVLIIVNQITLNHYYGFTFVTVFSIAFSFMGGALFRRML